MNDITDLVNNININININENFKNYNFSDNEYLNFFLKILIIKFNNCYNYLNNNLAYKYKHLSYICKIDSILSKYKYYEYLLDIDNKLLISIFENSQIIYFRLLRNVKKYSYKKFRIYNNEDINLELINNKNNNFEIYIDKFIYVFTYNDFIKIINTSLLNYEDTNDHDEFSNVFLKTKKIKNPYTNMEFKKYILYNFYIYCKNNKFQVPTIYKLFYESNFDIKTFCNLNEVYLTNNALKSYVKNLNNNSKLLLLIELINMFTIFIGKHIKNNNIKYIISNYKLNFYNLSNKDICYYDYYLRLYLLQIYYFKNNMIKNYVNLKLKIVLYLLFDKNIKFINKNFTQYFLSNITIEYISEIINTNLPSIMNYEIDIFNQLNGNTRIYLISNNTFDLSNNNENNETSLTNENNDTSETFENNETSLTNETSVATNVSHELEDITNSIYLDNTNVFIIHRPIKSKTIQNIEKICNYFIKQIKIVKNSKNIDIFEKFMRLHYINLKIIKRCLILITIINIHLGINVYILLKINNYIKLLI